MADGLGNTANSWVGDLDPEKALDWYGFYSFAMGMFGVFGFMVLNDSWWVAAIPDWYHSHMKYYLPAGMCWWMLRYFDNSEFLDKTMKIVTAVTIVGPFVEHWRPLGLWIAFADNHYYGNGYYNYHKATLYEEPWFWYALSIYTFTNFFEMIIQVTILEKVFEGIGMGDFKGLNTIIINTL